MKIDFDIHSDTADKIVVACLKEIDPEDWRVKDDPYADDLGIAVAILLEYYGA